MALRKEFVALALSAVLIVATYYSPLLKYFIEAVPDFQPANWTAPALGRGDVTFLLASASSLLLLVLTSLMLGFYAVGRFAWMRLFGSREGMDWWSLSGFAWLPLAVVFLMSYLLLVKYSAHLPGGPFAPKTLDAILSALLLLWLESLLLLPVAIPVLEAHAKGIYEVGVYFYCLIGLIALPFAAVLASSFFSAIVATNAGDSHNSFLAFYTVDPHIPHCASHLKALFGLSQLPGSGLFDRPVVPAAARFTLFWFDIEINTILLDVPNSVGCGLTELREIPDAWQLAASVVLFKIFTSIVAVGAIALPIRGRAARKAERAKGETN